MAKVSWKGGALLAPVPPVMVTCGSGETANIITVAWTGIINTHPPRVSISVRPTRHSYGLIKESGEFVINLTPAALVREADYCGIYTGAKVNKFEKTGLHPVPATRVACPLIEECPLALECRVLEVIPQGTHDLFLAEVVAVDVDESILDGEGKLCLDRAGLAAFAHGEYFALGDPIGRFGFSAAKKKSPAREGAKGEKKKAPAHEVVKDEGSSSVRENEKNSPPHKHEKKAPALPREDSTSSAASRQAHRPASPKSKKPPAGGEPRKKNEIEGRKGRK